MQLSDILRQQKQFFNSHKTKDIGFRKQQLKKLKEVIKRNEKNLSEAVYRDFGKSEFDTFTTELSMIYTEIDYFLKNLHKLSKPKSVRINLVNFPGKSKIYHEPLGNILVIGAWNYPIQLSILPAVGALAAGNTCIIKPSEMAIHTSNCIAEIINENFEPHYLAVVEGGIEETTELLNQRFDKIFFTGSTKVGKIVYEAAAKHLTPVTLELGGKSPCIVSKSADLKVAAKRIVWGKFLNAGQTCVAPDYLLVDDTIAQELIDMLIQQIKNNNYQPESDHYTKIINRKNFDRLKSLIENELIIYGGKTIPDQLFIEPTLLYPANWDIKAMQEEIFGPILPILTYSAFGGALESIQQQEKPLSAYLFSSDSEEINEFCNNISFGGGCVNDVVMHLTNDRLPFGGVGNSGVGNYHGKFSFETFSHQKSILKKSNWGEPNIKYPPYSTGKLNIIKKFL